MIGIVPVRSGIRIKDIRDEILRMGVIRIYVDGVKLWDDEDCDLTDLTEEDAMIVIDRHFAEENAVLSREDLVYSVNFRIVEFDHSECRITTCREEE